MITLGGITISDNMYLGGITQSQQIAYQQVRTVEGLSKLTTVSLTGGRNLTLGTVSMNSAIQGIWCQSVIDQLKDLEKTNIDCVLDFHGDTYNVRIIDTTDFTQMFQFEEVSPDKKYTGSIKMIEV